jgi:hypothetical protein
MALILVCLQNPLFAIGHEPPPLTCDDPELDPDCELPDRIPPWEISDHKAASWARQKCREIDKIIDGFRCYIETGDRFTFVTGDASRTVDLEDIKKAYKAQRMLDDFDKIYVPRAGSSKRRPEQISAEIEHYKGLTRLMRAAGVASPILLGAVTAKFGALATVPQLFAATVVTMTIAYGAITVYDMVENHIDDLEKELAKAEGPGSNQNPSLESGDVDPVPIGDNGPTVKENEDGSVTVTMTSNEGDGNCSSSSGYECPTGVMSECRLKVTITCNR